MARDEAAFQAMWKAEKDAACERVNAFMKEAGVHPTGVAPVEMTDEEFAAMNEWIRARNWGKYCRGLVG